MIALIECLLILAHVGTDVDEKVNMTRQKLKEPFEGSQIPTREKRGFVRGVIQLVRVKSREESFLSVVTKGKRYMILGP